MKTAVSLPDEIFGLANRLARKLKISRSELYRRALEEYLLRHSPDELTDAMNRVLADIGSDAVEAETRFAKRTSATVLAREKW